MKVLAGYHCKQSLKANKTLTNCSGTLSLPGQNDCPIQGYEIHAGLTFSDSHNSESQSSVISTEDNRLCAILSEDQQILATYWHGLLDTPEALQNILYWAGAETEKVDYQQLRENSINILADSMQEAYRLAEITSGPG